MLKIFPCLTACIW